MALKNLTADEMIALSAGWLESNAQRMKSIAEIAPLAPKLRTIHEALTKAAQIVAGDAALEKLSAEGLRVDSLHDDAIRALWHGFNAAAALHRAHGTDASLRDAREIEALRNEIIPQGLSATQPSFLAEAGAAQRIADKITKEQRKRLAKLKLSDADLDTCFALWIKHGQALGEIEHRRGLLNESGPSGLQSARNEWIAFMNVALPLLELSSAQPELVSALRDPVVNAAQRADLIPAPVPAPPPAPAPDPKP